MRFLIKQLAAKQLPAKPSQPKTATKQRGVALLMTLLVLAVITLALMQIQNLTQQDIELLHAKQLEQQGWGYLLGAEILAAQALADRRIREQPLWWASLRGQPLRYPIDDNGLVSLEVVDLRTCFNLNHLAGLTSEESSHQLAALLPWRLHLNQLQEEERWLSDLSLSQFLDLARDWVDLNHQALPEGAETGQYLLNNPPRAAANQPFADISEINWLGQENRSRFRQLPASLCVLPNNELKLNINTLSQAQLPLLWALFEGQASLNQLEAWHANRPEIGYFNLEEFWQDLNLSPANTSLQQKHANQLLLISDFYQLKVQLNLNEAEIYYQAYLYLSPNGQVQVYQRHYGPQDGQLPSGGWLEDASN